MTSRPPPVAVAIARRVYQLALVILPRSFRQQWQPDLQAFFDEASLDAYCRGGARRLARRTTRALGDLVTAGWRERSARLRIGGLIAALPHELHAAVRGLRRAPAIAVGAVITIALGAGVGTALFVIVHAALLAPLPMTDADRLVHVSVLTRTGTPLPASYPEYLDWQTGARTLDGVAGFSPTTVNIAGLDAPIRAPALLVSANFFSVLGVRFAEGRAFEAPEEREGRDSVAVVSGEFRRRHFPTAAGVVGREIRLGDRSYRIVGVLADGFRFDLRPGDVFLPLGLRPIDFERRDSRWLGVVGRRTPDGSIDAVRADLRRVTASTQPRDTTAEPVVVPLRSAIVSGLRQPLWLLAAASLLLTVAAAASLGGLAVTRTLARTREFAVRVAVGASARAVMLAVVTELACIAATGMVAAVAVGLWTVRLGLSWMPADVLAGAAYLDQSVPFVLVLPVAAALVAIACTPAVLLAGRSVAQMPTIDALKSGAAAARAGHSLPLGGVLVACQVAMAVILLIGAGLLGRSVARLLAADPGFSTARLSAFGVSVPRMRYPDDLAVIAFFDELVRRAGALPGVERAATIDAMPFTKDDGLVEVTARSEASGPAVTAVLRLAAPEYFATIGIDPLEGRVFDGRDVLGGPMVAVISRTLAHRLFPAGDAIGRRLQLTRSTGSFEIIGVVNDVRMGELDRDIAPAFYVNSRQDPIRSVQLVIRSALPLETLAPAVRAAVTTLDADVPVYAVRTLQEARESTRAVATRRLILYPVLMFAVLAASIAAVGVYALLGHAVSSRTREIGVRLALGAAPAQVWRLVVRQGLTPVLMGTLVGAIAAALAARALTHLLFGVPAADPLTFAAVALAMMALGTAAAAGPARRAARLDPAQATGRG